MKKIGRREIFGLKSEKERRGLVVRGVEGAAGPISGVGLDLAQSGIEQFALFIADSSRGGAGVEKRDENRHAGQAEAGQPIHREGDPLQPPVQNCLARDQHSDRSQQNQRPQPAAPASSIQGHALN
jgi:hypothetical protein